MARFFNVPSLTALFICSSLSAISTQLFAATVSVSENLIVSEVNDKTIDNGFIGSKSVFELSRGNHALIVRYKDVFEDLDFAEERRVESQDFVVKFAITDQAQLKLSTIKIKNLAEAETFIKSPKLKLKDGRDNQLDLSLEQVSDYKLAKQVDLVVNSLASKQIIQTNSSALPTASTPKSKNTFLQVNSLTMLKYWWQNASNEEKQRFKQFTNAK
ncbi:MAG: DUF2057 family protein [Colwellia sp.]|nr:DUF2057 family protein [Colwellia sp.]